MFDYQVSKVNTLFRVAGGGPYKFENNKFAVSVLQFQWQCLTIRYRRQIHCSE